MPLQAYLQDGLIELAERAYWLYQLAGAAQEPPTAIREAISKLDKQWRGQLSALPRTQEELLVRLSDAVAALRALGNGSSTPGSPTVSLGLWAAMHRYRTQQLGCTQGVLLEAACQAEPRAWRVDDRLNVVLLDLCNGLSVRLWVDLSFPRRLALRKSSHAQTLTYDPEARVFSTQDQQCVPLVEVVALPSTHVYRTTALSKALLGCIPVHRAGPVLPVLRGQSGTLF